MRQATRLLICLSLGGLWACRPLKPAAKKASPAAVSSQATPPPKKKEFHARHSAGAFRFFIDSKIAEVSPTHLYTEGPFPKFDKRIFIEGHIIASYMLDLDGNGFPEIYIIYQANDHSGNVGIRAYALDPDRGVSEVFVSDVRVMRKLDTDTVFVQDGKLFRVFVMGGEEVVYSYALSKPAGTEGLLVAKRVAENPLPEKMPSHQETAPSPDMTERIRNYLRYDYFREALDAHPDMAISFQLSEIDLNNDNQPEAFVRMLPEAQFCSDDGCILLLISDRMTLINKFKSVQAPVFVQPKQVNGWGVIFTRSEGVFKELVFENGHYPDDLLRIPKSFHQVPDPKAQLVFDRDYEGAQVFPLNP